MAEDTAGEPCFPKGIASLMQTNGLPGYLKTPPGYKWRPLHLGKLQTDGHNFSPRIQEFFKENPAQWAQSNVDHRKH